IENTHGGPQRTVYVGVSTDAGLGAPTFTFTDHKVFTSPAGSAGATNGNNNIFPALAVDDFGNVYTVWSDNENIFLSSSTNLGNTWTAPVRVNGGSTVGKANVFPWVAADANGHLVVTWLGASVAGNSNDVAAMQPPCAGGTTDCWAQWNVYAEDHLASPLCSQQSPGHCANNDPQSFRVGVPYFTYQLKPNKKVVTTGVCAR